jgi:ATP-dependent DNA helicase RecG
MIKAILAQEESKTVEFKESLDSTVKIIRTVVAFANTAGGMIIIGVKDKTKEVIGIKNILLEEERLSNVIADSIEPLLIPDIEIVTYDDKELLVIKVPYLVGPYYYKQEGLEKGIYVRLGSSNRQADGETIASLLRLSKQISFDEMPCIGAKMDALDNDAILKTLSPLFKKVNEKNYHSVGIITTHNDKPHPTHGGILLFGKNRFKRFPDSFIQCVCFAGSSRADIIDQHDIKSHLIDAIRDAMAFISRHTSVAAKIGAITREDIPQFPEEAVREAVINAIIHADYSVQGSCIQIAVFSDRIEITNPGGLPFGQTIELALAGFSRMRNRMMGRIFRELKFIEKLGSGLLRIIDAYKLERAPKPKIEDLGIFFRVTLYGIKINSSAVDEWELKLLKALSPGKELGTKQIAKLWGVTDRAARVRLKQMSDNGLIKRNAKSKSDPNATYSLAGH